jgi:hypothetical protein
MTLRKLAGLNLGVLVLGFSPAPAIAENAPVPVSIGSFASQQRCTVYMVTSGSEAMIADHRSAAAASAYDFAAATRTRVAWARQWRTDLVHDCVDNFQGLRDSLTAALTASGVIVVVPPGTRGALVLSGRVSDVGTATSATTERGNANSNNDATLTVDLSLAAPGGRQLFGSSIVKTRTFDEQNQSSDFSSSRTQNDAATYAMLQRELTLAVARAVIFHVNPIRVVSNTGRRVRVNYGAPLLTIGSSVSLDGGLSRGVIRGTVVGVGMGFAEVEAAGGDDLAAIRVGSTATFAEPEDPLSRSVVFPNVEFPN